MIIDILRLANNFVDKIEINTTYSFSEDYLNTSDIRRLDNVEIIGEITKPSEGIYNLNLDIKGEMILPCSVTLEDVKYPFFIEIDEILTEEAENDENYIKISNNSIDILPIIWQNIVMEVPLKVVSENARRQEMRGDGWRLISEDDNIKEIDPRLEKLTEIFNEGDEN